MTLLSIANAVADETHGPRPATIAANTSPDAQNIFRLTNRVGTFIMRLYRWNILTKEQTFTSVATEEQTSAIPTDFDRFIPETFWDRGTTKLLSGPISPVEWQGLKASGYEGTQRKFRHRGGSILTVPTLEAGSTMAFEYVSKNWAQNASLTAQASMTADTDTALIDEELIIRGVKFQWLLMAGQPTAGAAKQEFDDLFTTLVDNDRARDGILVAGDIFSQDGRHFDGVPLANQWSTY